MATTKQPSRLTEALLDTANDMRRVGVIDAVAHARIALRHLGETAKPSLEPLNGDDIR